MSPAAPLLQHLLSPLGPWLQDPATEDIAVNRPGEAWIRQRGAWLQDDVALGGEALEEIAILAGSLRKQEVGGLSPLCATELPDGERLQICLPPAVPQGMVSLTIRKHENKVAPLAKLARRYRAKDWNRWRNVRAGRDLAELLEFYDAGDLESFLAAAVRARLNMLLSGRTGSGKVARRGIRVNAVCPGPVDTRMIHSLEAQLNPADPASVGRRYQSAIPLGRYVAMDEIANTVLFLCSDFASAITGAQYVVDGGRTATGGAVTQAVGR